MKLTPPTGFLASKDLFVISHSGARAGAPMVLLRFLDWAVANTSLETDVILLHGGTMEFEFARFDARVVGGGNSRLWMLQRGLTTMQFDKAASALAFARLAPPMWRRRRASVVLLNSVGSIPALQFMPKDAAGKVALYVHELDESFDRNLGSRVWERLSPRIDHFISCSTAVTDMLVERKGVSPHRISQHAGFIEPTLVEERRTQHIKREMGIPADALVVGASGRPDWRKAPDIFVRVAGLVAQRRPDLDVHFVWLGGPMDGSPGWRLTHDLESSGLSGRLHLTGETLRPAEVMSLFDIFTLTSREDPFPLAMLEAASLGVPVVSFASGGAVEFASAGGAAPIAEIVPYLDVPAMVDVVIGLLDDAETRRSLGARGKEHVLATHTTEVAAPRLFDTLAELEPRLRDKFPTSSAHQPGPPGHATP